MECVILCAGYATRLYPLTINTPKALLPVSGKPILDHIFYKLPKEITKTTVVSNDKFYDSFFAWSQGKKAVTVLNDKTKNEDERLGGIGDLAFALEKTGTDDDLLLILGDNLFDFDLNSFVAEFKKLNRTLIGLYTLDLEETKKMSEVEVKDGKIVNFEEKPADPKTGLASIGIYAFPRREIAKIHEYMKTDKPKDGPGFLVREFVLSSEVYPFFFKGRWFDIGSSEVYEKAQRTWK